MDVDVAVKFGLSTVHTHTDANTLTWDTRKHVTTHVWSRSCIDTHTEISTDVDASAHTQTPFPNSCCRKAIYWPSTEVSSSKVNLRTCLMCSLSLSGSLALSEAERNSFTLQIQIHKQSGKMYSYHRWSYYGRSKLSNENIIHCKWHLNTYRQRKKKQYHLHNRRKAVRNHCLGSGMNRKVQCRSFVLFMHDSDSI